MKVIICIDDRGGIAFNNRRQSKDRVLISDVIADADGKTVYIDEYSLPLFKDTGAAVELDGELLCDGIHFVEKRSLKAIEHKIDCLVIYKWNRSYPFDMQLDIDLASFKLKECTELVGSSHDKITKEIYVK